jgi:rod shape determining protein RodA
MDRRWLQSIDKVIIVSVLLLCIIGILLIYSAGFYSKKNLWKKQIIWLCIGLIILLIISSIDYHIISSYSYYLYALTIIFLIVLIFTGTAKFGSSRWLKIGFFSFQPSELAKIAIALAITKFLYDNKGKIELITGLFISLILVIFPMILIIKQPDLGTALLFIPFIFILLYLIGLNMKYIVGLFICGGVLTPFLWFLLKDYQKQRIIAFLDPYSDPLGSGYAVIQSITAIGSGGIFGKGFLHGTQSQLKFIPVSHTDFIFSVLGEEFGLVGIFIVLFLYLVIIFQGIKIAMHARDFLGTLIALAFINILAIQMIINICVATGILPTTGLSLPFLSYGGSSLIVNMAAIGIILSVRVTSEKFIA